MTIKYELHAHHLYTQQNRMVATFDKYQDAIKARDAIDDMIQAVTSDTPLHFADGEPWHLEIVDIKCEGSD